MTSSAVGVATMRPRVWPGWWIVRAGRPRIRIRPLPRSRRPVRSTLPKRSATTLVGRPRERLPVTDWPHDSLRATHHDCLGADC